MTAISAHRGGSEAFAAQTYEAYNHAAASGAEYVEFDVRRLADGTLVCFHDAACGPPVATLSYAGLCRHAGYEVPTVPRLLALIAGRTRGHIDLAETGYEAEVVGLARQVLDPDTFVVTSMVDSSLRRVADAFPATATGLSLGRGVGDVPAYRLPDAVASDLFPIARLRACRATWAAINVNLAPWLLARCHRHGFATMVWTVDRDDQLDRQLRDRRVDVLVTNRPVQAMKRRACL